MDEYEGQRRFGGGTGGECDPLVLDILAGDAEGETSEIAAEHAILAYECSEDGGAKKQPMLKMIRRAS